MSVSDPIADMLTRIRNGLAAKHEAVLVPASKMKIALARILKDEDFIKDFEVLDEAAPQGTIKIHLRYTGKKQPVVTGLKRVSKPGLRVYVRREKIPRVYSGLGIAILSTPHGVMTGQQAWRRQVGGEVLCYVW